MNNIQCCRIPLLNWRAYWLLTSFPINRRWRRSTGKKIQERKEEEKREGGKNDGRRTRRTGGNVFCSGENVNDLSSHLVLLVVTSAKAAFGIYIWRNVWNGTLFWLFFAWLFDWCFFLMEWSFVWFYEQCVLFCFRLFLFSNTGIFTEGEGVGCLFVFVRNLFFVALLKFKLAVYPTSPPWKQTHLCVLRWFPHNIRAIMTKIK